jgi:pimeloyl-ACP methyl ester carboxylesterase
MTGIYKTPEGQRLVEKQYRKILASWPVVNRQFHVPTRLGETFVIECGEASAPPLLLLHGSLANSASWFGDVTLWAQSFRVFAIDVIGEPGLSASSRPSLHSDAYALWLDDVMSALSLTHASFVGVSLGGWLVLDYATRRPARVDRIAVVCPGGVGRQKLAILFKVLFLSLCGSWGKRKLRETVLGPKAAGTITPAMRNFAEFLALIHKNTRPRTERLPVFSDAALAQLTKPVLVIVGARDALLDSADTRRRIQSLLSNAEVLYLHDGGHFIPGQGPTINQFLSCDPSTAPSSTSPAG